MLQTKQKQQQHLYQQMQQFPRAPSAPILSRVPSTRSPMAPLLALPNQPPRLHPDHHMHPGARMPNRPVVGHPPLSVVRPGSTSTQSLLGPKPMMQQPVVMHQMPGISGGPGKRLPPPFLPTGVRQSLLGPAPVGAPLRNAHMGFVPGRQLNLYCPPYKNKGAVLTPQRMRENGQKPAGKSNGQMTKSKADIIPAQVEKKLEVSIKDGQASSNDQTEPLAKKQKNQRADEESESGDAECRTADTDSSVLLEQEEEEIHSAEAEEDLEQGRTAEVQGVGTSLKVTIQRSSDSRAFSTGLEESPAAAGQSTDKEKSESAGKFCCKICNVTCPDQQDFQIHMISLDHQMRMMEIQHLSNTCLATLLPQMQQSLQGTLRDKKQVLQRWCAICQCHFTGDLIEHRRTKKHKMAKVSSRPFCTVCERHFRTPRKFVEHMKSPEHKQRVEELREEGGPEVMEELITVDAIGCFEGEDDYEEEGSEDEEEDTVTQQVLPEEVNDCNDYDPDTQYGTSFVVPVAGFLCKLCHKFYHFESKAREAHCKSLMHYQNLQKYKAMLNLPQEDEESLASSLGESPENSRDCAAEMEDKGEKSKSQSDTTRSPQTTDHKQKLCVQ
ncbi:cdkn1a interacting zinc finger protein 1b isoform X2 [Colossoma macropomum]|uniref:cdkn1a interacting zinc finger protein 1b isoform X2 n=1 Tax=Colossoma macropomum TaxID=42526 RepID=UPI00186550BD|nr:cdkn1a interacting zinc finger protein 1b isoform X2 [Colossoma macropomum]